MVGKVTARSQGPIRKGRKQITTTFKKGGTVKKAKGGKITKKNMGGMMPGNQMPGNQMPGAPMMPGARQNMMHGGKVHKKKK